ncbi:MAG: hypothetical protein LRY66_01805 [Saccharospirillaceae bacterium]|nr:hypothetical protein [Saccharospirillaceae bacterium]MCD8530101.1 hypothetical protein [Saccharospirillaceae bacterium]
MKSPLGLSADLPVMDLITEAIALLWLKRSAVIRMFLPAMLILALVDWSSSVFLAEDDYLNKLVFIIVSIFLSVMFATSCHRFTLLPKEQWDANALHGIGREELRYLLRGILLAVIAVVVFFGTMLFAMVFLGQENAWLGAVIAVLPALYFWSRLSITLPELALGQKSDLKRAWSLSAGNGSRLVLVVFIAPVVMASPFLALFMLDHSALRYLAAFGTYITSLISLVMLSLSYRFLLDFYEPTTEAPAAESEAENKSETSGFDA